ncbi:helix-turn-helix domain-containing protein [Methylobacterium sp. Leaf118]|uniref:helix-turn-helix domain-containing protein n=1 Tax=Methylobacterium sp. Leaf118 TaxID=2876562 RepID=UPI001E64216A|nr:helix-turn-helix transcriptional regulator [Methylobacterium sp. Leaf118]
MRSVTEADQAIGQRIRAARRRQGLSLATLAEAVAVTSPQMEKYEGGANPITAARLARVAEHLAVSADDLLGLRATDPSGPILSDAARALAEAFDRLPEGQLKEGVYRLVLAAAADIAPEGRERH